MAWLLRGAGRDRRWALLAAGLVVVLLLAGSAAVYLTRGPGDARRGAGPAVSGPPVTPLSPSGAVNASPSRSGALRPNGGELVVRYRFDGALADTIPDEGRHLPLKISTAAGGALSAEPRAGGSAVRFPKPCPTYGDKSCPRAILESGPAESLNPGTGPLRFGATVRLASEETAKGENVLQKGYSQGDSQFKLQIDGGEGRPGCVLVGTGLPEINVLTATASVADGRWHVVECARVRTSLTITIDGAAAGRREVPAGLSIVNKEPLRIGGKGTGPNNDQFHGAIDDVFVAVGG